MKQGKGREGLSRNRISVVCKSNQEHHYTAVLHSTLVEYTKLHYTTPHSTSTHHSVSLSSHLLKKRTRLFPY